MIESKDRTDKMADLPERQIIGNDSPKIATGGMSVADARRGFEVLCDSHETDWNSPPVDDDGTTRDGDPWEQGGCLKRDRGFAR